MTKERSVRLDEAVKDVMAKPKDYLELWIRESLEKRMALTTERKRWEEAEMLLDQRHHAPKCPANHYHGQRKPTGSCNCGARERAEAAEARVKELEAERRCSCGYYNSKEDHPCSARYVGNSEKDPKDERIKELEAECERLKKSYDDLIIKDHMGQGMKLREIINNLKAERRTADRRAREDEREILAKEFEEWNNDFTLHFMGIPITPKFVGGNIKVLGKELAKAIRASIGGEDE